MLISIDKNHVSQVVTVLFNECVYIPSKLVSLCSANFKAAPVQEAIPLERLGY